MNMVTFHVVGVIPKFSGLEVTAMELTSEAIGVLLHRLQACRSLPPGTCQTLFYEQK